MLGTIGEFFASLAFASAFTATLGFFAAERESGLERKSWERLGLAGFWVHATSIVGIIATLFAMIYTHQYQYHYVWSHSSNELPVHFMISCFWEGQEGSFLLWCFWHVVLSAILVFTAKAWRNLVLGVVMSVEVILSSMLLGSYAGEGWVLAVYVLLLVAPAAYLVYRYLQHRNRLEALPLGGAYHLGAGLLAAGLLVLLVRGQAGYLTPWQPGDFFASLDGTAFGVTTFAWLGFLGLYLVFLYRAGQQREVTIAELVSGILLLAGAAAIALFEAGKWKVGSSPFLLLRDVFPENEAFQQNPDFIPTNGNGLNTLLQNYWMVIHPPTLFLGFAATVIPFAYAVAGLVRGDWYGWIRPAAPWTTFSVMILGVGIIMGGYWAYETLNFGGYWNWDPVENGSLVPWLTGVASLHALLITRRKRTQLKTSLILVMITFLLVLYATFLTRSGILGDTSVHTFTDLGLSGQLLILLLVYFAALVGLLVYRWRMIPGGVEDGKVWSAEFLTLTGVIILILASLVIGITTSLPVVNELFGTNYAAPTPVQFFYYKWTVWFAIAFGIASGVAQFLWFKIYAGKKLEDALFRPFLVAIVLACAILIPLIISRWEFAYDSDFEALREAGGLGNWVAYAFQAFADEFLLFSSLFVIATNLDVLIALLRKNKKSFRALGGTFSHIGFGLMLIGMLFSSGYDRVISLNLTPDEMAGFPDTEKADNIRLFKDQARFIEDYEVTYLGKKAAQRPLRNIEVIEETADYFKIRFRDKTNDQFGFTLPRNVFVKQDSGRIHTHDAKPLEGAAIRDTLDGEIDLEYVKDFLTRNLDALKPPHINNRTLYGVQFRSLSDSSDSFVLYPEAELNGEMSGIIAHPDRRIFPDRDLYVYVSQVARDDEEPRYEFTDLVLTPGDTARLGETRLLFPSVSDLSGRPEVQENFSLVVAANLVAISPDGDTLLANPTYLIDNDNKVSFTEASFESIYLDVALVRIDPEEGKFLFQTRQLLNPTADFIAIKAIRKPWINLLWLGTFILTFGFGLSVYRRVRER